MHGASVSVPRLEGKVQMKIAPMTASGSRLRLRGKGAVRRREGGRGDLYVVLQAVLPEAGDSEKKSRLQALARQMEELYAGQDLRSKLREAGS